jgi:hypothetical protein
MATRPQQTTAQPGPQTLAIATDPAYMLNLAPSFQPDIDLIVSEGVAAFGMKGAGKSNALARLLEQLSRYPIPFLAPDTKGEYTGLDSVPHASRFIVATANNCPSGYEILTERLQVVMDLRSWDTDEGAALAMSQILDEMFSYASSQAPADCIPCPCLLDEAQYWLPQQPVSYLSKDIARQLRDSWHVLATRARSLGLVPSYFTQNISELHKSVMRQCGLYVLMRQFLDADLDRYCEFIKSSRPASVKKAIRSFPAGKAVIVLPDGSQVKAQFHPRESRHPSATPTVRALMARLAPQPEEAPAPERNKGGRPRKQPAPVLPPAYERIYSALDRDCDLSPMELAARAGCDLDTAKEARAAYFTPTLV